MSGVIQMLNLFQIPLHHCQWWSIETHRFLASPVLHDIIIVLLLCLERGALVLPKELVYMITSHMAYSNFGPAIPLDLQSKPQWEKEWVKANAAYDQDLAEDHGHELQFV